MKHSYAFDRMLAGAFALSQHVLTAPYGAATLPEPATPHHSPVQPLSDYSACYRAVAAVRPPEPVIDAEALAGWVAQPRRSEA